MLQHKRIRARGKLGLSRVFKELKVGDRVAVVLDLAYQLPFPKRIQGKSGRVVGDRGKSVVVSLKDGNKEKTYIIPKLHLKKLK